MRAGSPVAVTDDWGRQAPAPVASLWSGAVPQVSFRGCCATYWSIVAVITVCMWPLHFVATTKASNSLLQTKLQQDQWQQLQHQPPPEPAGYQAFGPSPWAVPPTPDGQASPWQPQHSHPTPGVDQLRAHQMPWQQPEQQQRQPGGQNGDSTGAGAEPQSTEAGERASAELKASAPPLVQDWSWLSSLPSK